MIKISFTGDVSCDKPLLAACRGSDDSYDFSGVLSEVRALFSGSDHVIGNLETVFGGKSNGYNVRPFGYNSPDSFMNCLSEAGFTAFSTANNHCMDEGVAGLHRTLTILDQSGIRHAGTQVGEKTQCILESNGVKISLLSYAASLNKTKFADKTKHLESYVNLLYPYGAIKPRGIKSKVISLFPVGLRESVKRRIGIPTVTQVTDSIREGMLNQEYLEKVRQDIIEAKNTADLCIVCVHCGGQFNIVPGKYSEYILNYFAECGADAVIGNHPHIIQKIDVKDAKPLAFSLGGLTLSPSAEYVNRSENILAEYSLIVNLYIDEKTKTIKTVTYSICKGIEDANGKLSVVPVSDLAERLTGTEREKLIKDVQLLRNRITGNKEEEKEIKEEYKLYEI